jgi:membrane-bound metal-dependent hydrolase YbcI (DUF457 family)
MLFWVHAAVAYLLYRLILLVAGAGRLTGGAVLALISGALLPDIVDKPLSFTISSLPSRSLSHSIFTTVLVVVIAVYLARRLNRLEVGAAYTVGYLSHLGADLVDYLFIPQETLLFLFWPLVTDYHHIDTVHDLLALVSPTPYVLVQTMATIFGIVLWINDGKPGYHMTVRSFTEWRIRHSN